MTFSTSTFAAYVAIVGLALTFLIYGVALGQNAGQSTPGYSGASSAVNPSTIDDATVKQTAKAYVKIRQIAQKKQRALNNANDDAQKQTITAAAESDKIDAVKAEGLQPQQYNQVIQLAQANKALQQKLLSYVKEISPTGAD